MRFVASIISMLILIISVIAINNGVKWPKTHSMVDTPQPVAWIDESACVDIKPVPKKGTGLYYGRNDKFMFYGYSGRVRNLEFVLMIVTIIAVAVFLVSLLTTFDLDPWLSLWTVSRALAIAIWSLYVYLSAVSLEETYKTMTVSHCNDKFTKIKIYTYFTIMLLIINTSVTTKVLVKL